MPAYTRSGGTHPDSNLQLPVTHRRSRIRSPPVSPPERIHSTSPLPDITSSPVSSSTESEPRADRAPPSVSSASNTSHYSSDSFDSLPDLESIPDDEQPHYRNPRIFLSPDLIDENGTQFIATDRASIPAPLSTPSNLDPLASTLGSPFVLVPSDLSAPPSPILAPELSVPSSPEISFFELDDDMSKEVPIFKETDLVAAHTLKEFSSKLLLYFQRINVKTEKDKIAFTYPCFQKLNIVNWLNDNEDRFKADDYGTFEKFYKELSKKFLDDNWHVTYERTHVVKFNMEEDQSFSSFFDLIKSQNHHLKGTVAYRNDEALRKVIMCNISEPLDKYLRTIDFERRQQLDADDFDTWHKKMIKYDEQRAAFALAYGPPRTRISDAKRSASSSIAALTLQSSSSDLPNKRPRITSDSSQSSSGSRPYPSSGSNSRPLGRNPRSVRDPLAVVLWIDVNHVFQTCDNGWPPANFPRITEEYIADVRRAASKAKGKQPVAATVSTTGTVYNKFHLNVVAAFKALTNNVPSGTDYADFEFTEEEPVAGPSRSSRFEELETEATNNPSASSNAVGAVMYSEANDLGSLSPPPVLPEDADSSVDSVIPSSAPHLIWDCLSHDDEGSPLRLSCMLDSGAHLVLVRPDIVKKLGLIPQRARKPQLMSLALENAVRTVKLFNYALITLTSLNSAFIAKPVIAFIVPDLCSDILLGMPFLTHNDISLHCRSRRVIHNPSGFDLLNDNATIIERPHVKISPKQCRDARRKQLVSDIDAFKCELKSAMNDRKSKLENSNIFEPVKDLDPIPVIAATIEKLAELERLRMESEKLKKEFKDIFVPIPNANKLPMEEVARITFKDANAMIKNRTYSCNRQYREAFQAIIQDRLNRGFIRVSRSQNASPSFIIPKKDPKALPRWVCDYRELNKLAITDSFPIPRVEDILTDCAKGKIWATIDMTDSFFQTRMHPDDIHKTAVTTPFGLYEWCVMPMGFKNAPAIHQRRVTNALRKYIGKICHVYIDDIVIWSDSVDEHIRNCRLILQALRDAKLYVNEKKTNLFCNEIHFLGHKISRAGIEADNSKVQKILDWPVPTSATEVRRFLGLVRYLNAFLPKLAIQSAILDKLTTKSCNTNFPAWTQVHQSAFEKIKNIVTSRKCLTIIDRNLLHSHKIFLTTDASESCTGAVLSFGITWETARPVAFDSETLKGAELNYAVHEKELLAVLRALRKWRSDLMGSPFLVYTDHKTLLNFSTQKHLSRRQWRWMEEISEYDCKFVYLKGSSNSVADALSRYPFHESASSTEANAHARHPWLSEFVHDNQPILQVPKYSPMTAIAALVTAHTVPSAPSVAATAATGQSDDCLSTLDKNFFNISINDELVKDIREGYVNDPWCDKLKSASKGMNALSIRNGLWFLGDRLVVPAKCGVRAKLFQYAHDLMGHFGSRKTYDSLRSSFFWPNMRTDLEKSYIASCDECQRNKSSTSKPTGPLHPLPVPDARFESIAMDFIGELPEDNGHNQILTITDRLGADIRIIPCNTTMTAQDVAVLFHNHWYCENGLPADIISDRDTIFMSKFWEHFTFLTGIKHKASTSFHPQTDGSSERTNKTVNQAIRFYIDRHHKGWVNALPAIRFHIMNTVNRSTSFSPFQLRLGTSPRILPPMLPLQPNAPKTFVDVYNLMNDIFLNVQEAKDNLQVSKITQAFHANKKRKDDPTFAIGDWVLLNTKNRVRIFKNNDGKRAAKWFPIFDGPYKVTNVNSHSSTVTLDLPFSNIFPTFHTDRVKKFVLNDDNLYPHRANIIPEPVEVDGQMEFFVDKIIDHRRSRRGVKYLVKWAGFGEDHNEWMDAKDLEDNEAVDIYLASHPDAK
ncbi:hypothetical protein CVT24_008781 [Panaeolus cyanescens]|uniref:RNA-directed DNA polymerase n=1 Tax=Panaeolus cyanescens TaxID=181874 RepID=A0A409WEI0_9AGAR|nr:hypothetical protein CVT24_008781 [Panaeolus cyanescens]